MISGLLVMQRVFMTLSLVEEESHIMIMQLLLGN